MQYFMNHGSATMLIIRMDQGDMLLEGIERVLKETGSKNGVVISGIGTLSDAKIHRVTTTGYPAIEVYPEWKNCPIELCSISGIIADGTPHLHMVFSDDQGTYSGHMEPGCRTLYLCEVVIELFDEIKLERKRDEKNILVLQTKEKD